MTGEQWRLGHDLEAMVRHAHLHGTVSERQWRLLLVACVGRVAPLALDRRVSRAVEGAARVAEGQADLAELEECRVAVDGFLEVHGAAYNAASEAGYAAYWMLSPDFSSPRPIINALHHAADARAFCSEAGPEADAYVTTWLAQHAHRARTHGDLVPAAYRALHDEAWQEEARHQADLIRCVAGDPTHEPFIDPAWRRPGANVATLARILHDEERFEELPILADALEDAGCTDEQLLTHARAGGPHVRGCWLLEALR